MKKYLVIIAFLTCNIAFSQDYLSTDSQWTEYKVSCGGFGLGITCISEKYTIFLEGDTTINNILYNKTRRIGTETTWDQIADTIISELPIDENLFPLREDQKSFYIYDIDTEEDLLLHNFDLDIGDLAVSSNTCQNSQIVTEIESLSFGNQMRNKFSLFSNNSPGMSSLYEGIGSTQGLFVRPCSGMTAIESGSKILCYSANNETIILDSFSICETTLSVTSKQLEIDNNNIYPNPFDEKIVIKNSFSNPNDLEILLFDNQGRLVKSISNIEHDDQIEIVTSGLNSGFYVLLIRSNNKLQSNKLIKL